MILVSYRSGSRWVEASSFVRLAWRLIAALFRPEAVGQIRRFCLAEPFIPKVSTGLYSEVSELSVSDIADELLSSMSSHGTCPIAARSTNSAVFVSASVTSAKLSEELSIVGILDNLVNFSIYMTDVQ